MIMRFASRTDTMALFEPSPKKLYRIQPKMANLASLDEKSNLQIPSNLLQRFGTAAVCIALLIFTSGLSDFTLHLQIRKYDGLTYCGRITKIITTAF